MFPGKGERFLANWRTYQDKIIKFCGQKRSCDQDLVKLAERAIIGVDGKTECVIKLLVSLVTDNVTKKKNRKIKKRRTDLIELQVQDFFLLIFQKFPVSYKSTLFFLFFSYYN
jgi:hypothetical protein